MRATARTFCRTLAIVCAAVAIALPESFGDPADDSSDKQLAGIRRRAEQGYITEQLKLGKAYLTGQGAPQDVEESARWYKRAAELGNPEAQNILAYFYQRGIGTRPDADRALHWYRMASSGGLPSAQVNLGIIYLHGDGVHQSYSMARSYFERATEKGSGLGAAYLGDMELLGLGCPRDVRAAEKWYRKGVQLHDPVAAYDLAYLYAVAPNHVHKLAKAVQLLHDAIRKGFAPAKHALGFLLVNHPELKTPGEDAGALLHEASDAGQWRASALLAILARDGGSGKANRALAYYYFRLAACQGGEEARVRVQSDLAALASTLSQKERTAAESRAESSYHQQRNTLVYQADASGKRATINFGSSDGSSSGQEHSEP